MGNKVEVKQNVHLKNICLNKFNKNLLKLILEYSILEEHTKIAFTNSRFDSIIFNKNFAKIIDFLFYYKLEIDNTTVSLQELLINKFNDLPTDYFISALKLYIENEEFQNNFIVTSSNYKFYKQIPIDTSNYRVLINDFTKLSDNFGNIDTKFFKSIILVYNNTNSKILDLLLFKQINTTIQAELNLSNSLTDIVDYCKAYNNTIKIMKISNYNTCIQASATDQFKELIQLNTSSVEYIEFNNSSIDDIVYKLLINELDGLINLKSINFDAGILNYLSKIENMEENSIKLIALINKVEFNQTNINLIEIRQLVNLKEANIQIEANDSMNSAKFLSKLLSKQIFTDSLETININCNYLDICFITEKITKLKYFKSFSCNDLEIMKNYIDFGFTSIFYLYQINFEPIFRLINRFNHDNLAVACEVGILREILRRDKLFNKGKFVNFIKIFNIFNDNRSDMSLNIMNLKQINAVYYNFDEIESFIKRNQSVERLQIKEFISNPSVSYIKNLKHITISQDRKYLFLNFLVNNSNKFLDLRTVIIKLFKFHDKETEIKFTKKLADINYVLYIGSNSITILKQK